MELVMQTNKKYACTPQLSSAWIPRLVPRTQPNETNVGVRKHCKLPVFFDHECKLMGRNVSRPLAGRHNRHLTLTDTMETFRLNLWLKSAASLLKDKQKLQWGRRSVTPNEVQSDKLPGRKLTRSSKSPKSSFCVVWCL